MFINYMPRVWPASKYECEMSYTRIFLSPRRIKGGVNCVLYIELMGVYFQMFVLLFLR